MKKKMLPAGPLMCWDIFMESHYRRMQKAEGLELLQAFAKAHRWRIDWNLNKLLLAEERVALVTDTAQIIQFATPNMQAMTGYEVEELIGQTPRILQGKDTDAHTRKLLREAIAARQPFSGSLLNYRKNGMPYDCWVDEYPVWNKKGVLVNFVAFEKVA